MLPTKKQIDALGSYYVEFLEHVLVKGEKRRLPVKKEFILASIEDPFRNFVSNEEDRKRRMRRLTFDKGFPKRIYDEKRNIIAIQLRNIVETKLIIGCGNNPTSDVYRDERYRHMYGDHSHTGYATIDPDIEMNPTIVAYFGYGELPQEILPPQFTEIECEGIRLEGSHFYDQERERLLVATKRIIIGCKESVNWCFCKQYKWCWSFEGQEEETQELDSMVEKTRSFLETNKTEFVLNQIDGVSYEFYHDDKPLGCTFTCSMQVIAQWRDELIPQKTAKHKHTLVAGLKNGFLSEAESKEDLRVFEEKKQRRFNEMRDSIHPFEDKVESFHIRRVTDVDGQRISVKEENSDFQLDFTEL